MLLFIWFNFSTVFGERSIEIYLHTAPKRMDDRIMAQATPPYNFLFLVRLDASSAFRGIIRSANWLVHSPNYYSITGGQC